MSTPLPDALRDLLALQLTPGLGPVLTAALLRHFGSATAARKATVDQLLDVQGFGQKLANKIGRGLAAVNPDAELARIARLNVRLLVKGTPEYPAYLAEISDAPQLLYLRGQITEGDREAVALVGSRECSEYGKRIATKLASGLARAGYTVVSGLARGIDGIAHRAALDAGGRTLAVLAGGLSRIYPPEHVPLANDVEANGAVITESSMDQEPMAPLFPARNRIISGLSRAVVIVEAGERSGALITATHAAEQGRHVLAVPGAADGQSGAGCNALIRKGAVLCRGVDDILEEIHGVSVMAQRAAAESKQVEENREPAAPAGPPPGLDETERRIWDFLAPGPRTTDEMVQQLGLAVPVLNTMLMMLEMRKVVKRVPGSRYERYLG